MPRPRPPHLQRHKTRHGKFVWYVQIGNGPLIRLRAEFGSPEFDKEYRDAIARAGEQPAPKLRAAAGTLEWAWLSYKQSNAWRAGLTRATQRHRENIMRHVLELAGHEQVTAINRESILAAVDARSDTPFMAKVYVQTMRGLFKWLIETKRVKVDPTAGVSVKRPKTEGFLEWTEDDVAKYEARWPLGTRERVMLDVYMYTGLRRGDAARLGKQHVHNGVISIALEKSQRRTMVHLPMLDVLKRTLDAGPIGDLTFIISSEGKPYTKESLGNKFKDACVEAGVLDKAAHGLRKAAATRAADNGATAHELMAIFGWINIKEAEVYTRRADRKRLARQAMTKLER